ncbi:hypothetical protein K7432_013283 [Basidiobolus ranarum]|uniref:Uncharacterized protein n=1 Tax=Basidiobolus ranarum TaxID=34480 RepID=A0ABR2VR15_9FUNG
MCKKRVLFALESWFTQAEPRPILPVKKRQNLSMELLSAITKNVFLLKATHSRDSLSALAIGLSGLAILLFGAMIPTFTPKTSQFKTESFIYKAVTFLNRNVEGPTSDDVE